MFSEDTVPVVALQRLVDVQSDPLRRVDLIPHLAEEGILDDSLGHSLDLVQETHFADVTLAQSTFVDFVWLLNNINHQVK